MRNGDAVPALAPRDRVERGAPVRGVAVADERDLGAVLRLARSELTGVDRAPARGPAARRPGQRCGGDRRRDGALVEPRVRAAAQRIAVLGAEAGRRALGDALGDAARIADLGSYVGHRGDWPGDDERP